MENLPVEIILLISKYLNSGSLVSLIQTCKYLYNINISLLWSHVEIFQSPAVVAAADRKIASYSTNLHHYMTLHHISCTSSVFTKLPLSKIDSFISSLNKHANFVKVLYLSPSWIPMFNWSVVAKEFATTNRIIDLLNPELFVNLQLLEIKSDHAYSCTPLIRGVMKKFESCSSTYINLIIDQGLSCLTTRLFEIPDNVKKFLLTFECFYNGCKFSRDLNELRLSNSVERFDLIINTTSTFNPKNHSNVCRLNGDDLSIFLSRSEKLKFLRISGFVVQLKNQGNWVPDTVTELCMEGQDEWVSESLLNIDTLTIKNCTEKSFSPLFPNMKNLHIKVDKLSDSLITMIQSCAPLNLLLLQLGDCAIPIFTPLRSLFGTTASVDIQDWTGLYL